ncbi:MAG: hypothetical protein IEMM0006_2258 [bacterium]|nr:MAG: hypothetical protein IEMM0006_2258 [bacterium]
MKDEKYRKVIKSGSFYELDDPFFARWIKRKREE